MAAFSLQKEKKPEYHSIIDSLSIAVDFGHYAIAEYLLSQGANPNGLKNRENKNEAPIFYAIKNNNPAMVQLLIQNNVSLTCHFPLIHAILLNKIRIINDLIKAIGFSAALGQVQKARTVDLGPVQNHMMENAYTNLLYHQNQIRRSRQSSASSSSLNPMQ